MANQLRNVGGVGMNTRYDVYSGGELVGRIARHVNAVRLYGHYELRLAGFNSFPDAKAAAETMTFPTKWEAYEQVCAKIEANRKAAVEKQFGPRLASLARALASGSNSAADQMMEFIEAMDTFIADRSHSTRKPEMQKTANWETEYLLDLPMNWAV